MSGAMEFHKSDIFTRELNEFSEEVKNQEKVKLWEFWEQASRQATGLQRPALHITGNHRPILTVIRFEDFADMRLELKQLRETIKVIQEREMK